MRTQVGTLLLLAASGFFQAAFALLDQRCRIRMGAIEYANGQGPFG
jgi:hypothetical protein